jgi:site-specific recombinase XerD
MKHLTQPMTPLRLRMIEEMTLRKLSRKTQTDYLRAVIRFSEFLGCSPDTATAEDLRQYQLHLVTHGISNISLNVTITALRFFFNITLDRAELLSRMSHVSQPRTLPVILSPEEVKNLLESAPHLKSKAALSVAYGAGLRSSEVVALKVGDIDSQRMLIRVVQGKGSKDRYSILSPTLLRILRLWWSEANHQNRILKDGWLFPGRTLHRHLCSHQLRRWCHTAAESAGITKQISIHTLRHSFATHLLEQKVDIRVIQVLLGHKRLETTALYSQVATRTLCDVISPLDRFDLNLPAS